METQPFFVSFYLLTANIAIPLLYTIFVCSKDMLWLRNKKNTFLGEWIVRKQVDWFVFYSVRNPEECVLMRQLILWPRH